jgi:hypothetical protein
MNSCRCKRSEMGSRLEGLRLLRRKIVEFRQASDLCAIRRKSATAWLRLCRGRTDGAVDSALSVSSQAA